VLALVPSMLLVPLVLLVFVVSLVPLVLSVPLDPFRLKRPEKAKGAKRTEGT
jgi:hypothetical protein